MLTPLDNSLEVSYGYEPGAHVEVIADAIDTRAELRQMPMEVALLPSDDIGLLPVEADLFTAVEAPEIMTRAARERTLSNFVLASNV